MEDVVTAAAVVVVIGAWLRDAVGPRLRWAVGRIEEWRAPSTVEAIADEYARGELTEEEMEQRLDAALDTREHVVRDRLDDIDDVGPTRSAEVADAFGSIEAVRRASVDELAEVKHVGETTAQKILDDLRETA